MVEKVDLCMGDGREGPLGVLGDDIGVVLLEFRQSLFMCSCDLDILSSKHALYSCI